MPARIPLPGSDRSRPESHRHVGAVEGDELLGVTVVVRPRPGSPALPDLADWHTTPPSAHRFVSPEEYRATYGAAEEDLERVAAFAHTYGLTVRESHAGRRSVTLVGTAAQMGAAFGVELQRYEAPLPKPAHRTRVVDEAPGAADEPPPAHLYHGFEGQVSVPEELADIVIGVVGLDNRRFGGHAGGTGDPSGAVAKSVPATAALYNFPTSGAADQTVGVVSMGGASYLASDITDHYFPGIAETDYQTAPAAFHDVSLTVGTTTYSNSPSTVQEITSSNLSSFDDVLEVTQDISTSTTIAQGATVVVYFTEFSEQGWLVMLNRILQPESEPQPTVVTCSFFVWRGDDSSNIGSLSDAGSAVSLITAQFQQLALLGINVFIAQGDWGADDGVVDGKARVQYAATDPWVTSCGATVLAVDSSSSTGIDEWVWSDSWSSSWFGSSTSDWGSTGGGVSATFPSPPYQTAAGITGATDSKGLTRSGRGVPDIAAMVGYSGSGSDDWFYANGIRYNFIGTSCVAPLMAGLAAVMRSAFGRAFGPYNSLLYQLRNVAFNDVTKGNNDSSDSPDSPYFTADSGWDACTGLGTLDGTKLLNGIASLLYTPEYYFDVNKGSFGLDEVNITSSFPDVLWLALEGFTSSAVAAANLAPQVAASLSGVHVTVGSPQPELANEPNTPQRVLFPCSVTFDASARKTVAQGGIFPAPGGSPTSVALVSSVTIGGQILTCESTLELEPGADPFFSNFDAAGSNPFYLSEDLRVFTVTPGVDNAPIGGIALNASSNTTWDTAAAYNYIGRLLAHLNATFSSPADGDAFAGFPDQTNALSGDSSITPTSLNPAHATGTPFANYNFAVARVRLNGAPNSSSGAPVRVLFRLFAAETGDTDYQSLTYPSTTDGAGQPLAPLLAAGNVTIPFFATGNYQANSDFGVNSDYSGTSINNQPVSIGASGQAFAYYGCYLNIYPTDNTINGVPVQAMLPGTHNCIVAQLSYDDAPMPTGAGILQGPEYSDNFAQRNLQVTFSDNPGPAAAHRVPQTFDSRPGPALGTGELLDYPDELMIDWGTTPVGSLASIYWPQVDAAEVLTLAAKLYSTHQLRKSVPNTIECTVPDGFTFVPIPSGNGENFAGLFTVDLPSTVRAGDEHVITVRRLSTRRAKVAPPPIETRAESSSGELPATAVDPRRRKMDNWRYVVGSFGVRIPVTTAATMLPLEETTYAIVRWRRDQLGAADRWAPVLDRYLTIVEGRIRGLGGDPSTIKPSPYGLGPATVPDRRSEESTGKVDAVVYDSFGDFAGFVLRTEDVHDRHYVSREQAIESLVYRAWVDRTVVTVISDVRDPERPVRIVLRRQPRRTW